MGCESFDAIIIGSGIAGLVCGCYLSKAGKKVLVIEKNNKVGGYCTSFEREEFKFDVGVHGFGGLYPEGIFSKILDDLNLRNELDLIRFNPSDIIIFDKFRVNFWNDIKQTIDEFQRIFPNEAENISLFFAFLLKTGNFDLYVKLRNLTFIQFLKTFFKNRYLIDIFSIPLGNLGIAADILSATVGALLYKEFLINGGFYPFSGVEKLPNVLQNKFSKMGGKIFLSTEVKQIKITYGKTRGVIIEKGEFIKSKCVISNSDCIRTFCSLIESENTVINKFRKKIKKIICSPSAFVVYVGMNDGFNDSMLQGNALWYFPSYDKKVYLHNKNLLDIAYKSKCVFCSSANLSPKLKNNKKSLHLLIMAPFFSEKFWIKHKTELMNDIIARFDNLIPFFSKNIIFKAASSPYDFYKYTYNYKGASYGWASLLEQTKSNLVSFRSPIENLFLCGHWTTTEFGQGGVSTVASSGFLISKHVNRYLNTH